MAILTEKDKRAIESRIAEAEKKTSGEIVVRVVTASGHYAWIWWALFSLGLLVPTAAFDLLCYFHWEYSPSRLLEWQLAGAFAGIALSYFTPLRRWVSGQQTRCRQVHQQALAYFLSAGLVETRDRTGILIYVSEFERRAEILADKGIHAIVGDAYWNEQIAGIVQGLANGAAAEALCRAVDEMGSKLATHFPPRPDDSDEIPNRVMTD